MHENIADIPFLYGYYGKIDSYLEQTLEKLYTQDANTLLIPFITMAGKYGLPIGRYPLLGDTIYASCEKRTEGEEATLSLESHTKYCDIHLALEGTDLIAVSPLDKGMKPVSPYDETKDIFLYDMPPSSSVHIIELIPGSFVIFPPHICHAPFLHKKPLTKLVIKIEMRYFL